MNKQNIVLDYEDLKSTYKSDKLNTNKIASFCKLYNDGSSLREISRKEGISPNTVKKYLLLNNVDVKCKNLVYQSTNDGLLTGTYLGMWAGDGTQFYDKGYRIKICCHSSNKKMIDFFKFILFKLFNKTITHVANEERHRSLLRFNSKFIYYFVFDYIDYTGNKTHNVHLKKDVHNYSDQFLKGFILGLTLTDGYLKDKFQFNVTSNRLSKNVMDILDKWNFNPNYYIHDRSKYGWKDLHMISLNKKESQRLLGILNLTLMKLKYSDNFQELKYEGKMARP